LAVEREVYRAIMVRQTVEGWRYPVISYLNQLDTDLNYLHNAIQSVNKGYRERLSWASQAYDSLTYIRNIVVTSVRYMDEFNQRERDRLERERIALKEQEIEAHRRELRALEEQNRLRRQELALEEQRLRDKYMSRDYADVKASITITL
jgi:hypothetical protein